MSGGGLPGAAREDVVRAPGRPSAAELRRPPTPQPRRLSGRGRDLASAVPGVARRRPLQVRRRWLWRVGLEDRVLEAVLRGSVRIQLRSGSETAPSRNSPPPGHPTPVPLKVPQSISPVCAVTRDVCPQLVPKCRKSSVGPGEGCISVGQKTVYRGGALAALLPTGGPWRFGVWRLDGKFGMLLSLPPCQSRLSASWESTSVPEVC